MEFLLSTCAESADIDLYGSAHGGAGHKEPAGHRRSQATGCPMAGGSKYFGILVFV